MRDKKWLYSPWTISIGTSIFSLLLTIVYDYSKNKPIFSTIYHIAKAILSFVFYVLNYNLKVWWVILGLFIMCIIIYLIATFRQEFKPDYYSYREGRFKKWKWTWGWKWDNYKNGWVISNLTAHCPTCDTQMIDYSNRYELNFVCPRCDYRASGSQCDEPYKIEMIILDNIKREIKNKSTQ
jgi:Ca2+/Na+ antiporter